ncbi:unnamed protein product [Protopolystoma xenopodis]|uniref:Malic enzyme n=1 Tax=Protopolystoma xenopodis TaxID=117903 RepID=A0A448XAZ6_9PLAT|nr:unnamed protein product [Protopolystoma xenopodis]
MAWLRIITMYLYFIQAIVITDGERILGLGDLGSNGMSVPVGKVSLYTALAGIRPHYCLPITVDVGTNNTNLLQNDYYPGLQHERVTGEEYDAFMDEVMEAIAICYGPNVCIHFEDFATDNAFRLLNKYRNQYITFNGDIQASGATILAGILASSGLTNIKFPNNTFLIHGSGQVNYFYLIQLLGALGIAHFLTQELIQDYGFSEEEALKKIYLMDSSGLVVKDRVKNKAEGLKALYARSDLGPMNYLNEVVRAVRPTVLIGVSAQPGAFSREILREMGAINKRPLIFAMSNPTDRAECTAEMAYKATECRSIFVSGSPFPSVRTPDGQEYYPSQGNSCYIFPGLALALTCTGIRPVSDQVFLRAAKTLASLVTDEHLSQGRIYPPLSDLGKVSLKIAIALAEDAFKSGTASYHPEPKDKASFIKRKMYNFGYLDFTPECYSFPSFPDAS